MSITRVQATAIAHAVRSAWLLGLVAGMPDEDLPQHADHEMTGAEAREILIKRHGAKMDAQLVPIMLILGEAL